MASPFARPACIAALLAVGCALLHGCAAAPPGGETPRLVVVLVVDQMRPDHLTRFADQFTGGLKRIREQAALYDDAHQDHALTLTAPGHAALSTGTYPRKSGIVGNEWWDRAARRSVYSVEDAEVRTFGDDADGGRSPRRLLRDTLGDWLRDASPASEVWAVAGKDRSAILLGGHHPDGAFWIDTARGGFTSSTYYGEALPDWVEAWNERSRSAARGAMTWALVRPEEAYARSRDGAFPHVYAGPDEPSSLFRWLRGTPFGDLMVLDLAQEIVTRRRLGADGAPDLLWLGCSAADAIGHTYGPFSREAQDYYLRLDQWLGHLMDFLDRSVGNGRWALVLASDHGVLPLPEYLRAQGTPATRYAPQLLANAAGVSVQAAARRVGLRSDAGVHFQSGVVLDLAPDVDAVTTRRLREETAVELRGSPMIEDVYTYDELLDPATPDRPFLEAYRRSLAPGRGPDLFLRMTEYSLTGESTTGTTHGSPYDYDSHIPLAFLGRGVRAGVHHDRAAAVDVAPTLAAWLGIEPGPQLDGRALPDLLESAPRP